MDGVFHEPLQREKRDRTGLLLVALRTFGQRTTVYAANGAFKPPTGDIQGNRVCEILVQYR